MGEDDIIFKREELYKQVWETPMCRLAASYGISDVGLKKICKKLNIPTPPRGYWAKREYGYNVDRIPLPKKVYDQHVSYLIDKYAIDKRNKKTEIEGHRYIPDGIDLSKPIIVGQKLRNPHPLVQRVKALCEDDQPDKYGVVWPGGKEVFDIRVSPKNLSRALRILDCIVKWFEDNGFDFSESNSQFPKALLTVHGETMKFAIHEKVNRIDHIPTKKELEEQKKWSFVTPRLWDYEPSGKLSIIIDDWNSNGIQKKWSDTAKRKVEETLNSFVINIFQIAYFKHLKRLEQEEEERQWQLKQERRAEERRHHELEKQRLRDLENHAANWEKSNRIRSFVSAVEEKVTEMGTTPEISERLKKWASWAINHADSLDPISGDKVLSVITHEADVLSTTET